MCAEHVRVAVGRGEVHRDRHRALGDHGEGIGAGRHQPVRLGGQRQRQRHGVHVRAEQLSCGTRPFSRASAKKSFLMLPVLVTVMVAVTGCPAGSTVSMSPGYRCC